MDEEINQGAAVEEEVLDEGLSPWLWLVFVLVLAAIAFFVLTNDVPEDEDFVEPLNTVEDVFNSNRSPSAEELLNILDEDYPLLPSESVTSTAFDTRDGEMLISFFSYATPDSSQDILNRWEEYANGKGLEIGERTESSIAFNDTKVILDNSIEGVLIVEVHFGNHN